MEAERERAVEPRPAALRLFDRAVDESSRPRELADIEVRPGKGEVDLDGDVFESLRVGERGESVERGSRIAAMEVELCVEGAHALLDVPDPHLAAVAPHRLEEAFGVVPAAFPDEKLGTRDGGAGGDRRRGGGGEQQVGVLEVPARAGPVAGEVEGGAEDSGVGGGEDWVVELLGERQHPPPERQAAL